VDFQIEGLHHFAWKCRDTEETRRFYEDLLGLPLVHVIRNEFVPSTEERCPYVHIFFRMADGSHIAFFDLGDGINAQPSPNTPAWVNHIALRVGSRQQLLAAKGRLEAAGVHVVGIIDHEIIQSIYFFDPNGFRVELTCVSVNSAVMDQHARHAHDLLREWESEKGNAQHGDTTLG